MGQPAPMPGIDSTAFDANGLPGKPWLSPNEVAAYLGVKPKTIYKLVGGGQLGAVRVGGLIRVSAKSIRDYLAANKLGSGPANKPAADTEQPAPRGAKAGEPLKPPDLQFRFMR
jgi:excisionase family DNA binding protein